MGRQPGPRQCAHWDDDGVCVIATHLSTQHPAPLPRHARYQSFDRRCLIAGIVTPLLPPRTLAREGRRCCPYAARQPARESERGESCARLPPSRVAASLCRPPARTPHTLKDTRPRKRVTRERRKVRKSAGASRHTHTPTRENGERRRARSNCHTRGEGGWAVEGASGEGGRGIEEGGGHQYGHTRTDPRTSLFGRGGHSRHTVLFKTKGSVVNGA